MIDSEKMNEKLQEADQGMPPDRERDKEQAAAQHRCHTSGRRFAEVLHCA